MTTDIRCLQCSESFPAHVVEQFEGMCPACVAGFAALPTPVPDNTLASGSVFGRYEIISVLGRGGMGVVYLARQTGLDRLVALKVLSPRLAADQDFVNRFSHEAMALARLSHPNIVAVHDSGVEAGLPFLAMEHVVGENLRALLQKQRLEPERGIAIVPQLCNALEYAHAQGIIHRDIKPENILLDRAGEVKIADFGLAMLVGAGASRLTQTNAVMGTPHYMAPEQVENPKAVDHRADIYSMGVVFYEMLTGELPIGAFSKPSEKAKISRHLDDIVLRALAKEPLRRYQHAKDLQTDLSRTPVAPSASGVVKGYEWKSRSTLFGWPLVHICFGQDAQGRMVWAKGIVAIGNRAIGAIAMGGAAFGLLALGGAAMGLLAVGGAALGLLLAWGGGAIGAVAVGGGALGGVAYGGGAYGYYAMGGGAGGRYVVCPDRRDPEAERFFSRWVSMPPAADLTGARPSVVTSQPPSPGREITPADGKVDLVALINPEKDTVKGQWSVKDGALLCRSSSPGILQIPVEPPAEYDLSFTAVRTKDSGSLNIGLVKGESQFMAVIDGCAEQGCKAGLHMVDGWHLSAKENPTARKGRLIFNDIVYKVECIVRNDRLTVTFNGTTIIRWKDSYSRLANEGWWRVPNENALFIAAFDGGFRFTEFTLLPVSGKGRVLR